MNAKHCEASLRKRQILVICTHSYVTAADGPVCHFPRKGIYMTHLFSFGFSHYLLADVLATKAKEIHWELLLLFRQLLVYSLVLDGQLVSGRCSTGCLGISVTDPNVLFQ